MRIESRFNRCLMLLSLFAVLVETNGVGSTTAVGGYEGITKRNPFALKPAIAPVLAPAPPLNNPVKPTIFLTGITVLNNLKNQKRAYLVILAAGGASSPKLVSIAEGEWMEGIEVLEINEKDRTVVVRCEELEEMVLTFKTHAMLKNIPLSHPIVNKVGAALGQLPDKAVSLHNNNGNALVNVEDKATPVFKGRGGQSEEVRIPRALPLSLRNRAQFAPPEAGGYSQQEAPVDSSIDHNQNGQNQIRETPRRVGRRR